MDREDEPLIRIGELSRRLGVSVDRLRARERRYQLLEPMRTAGSPLLPRRRAVRTGDEDQLAAGLSAAEAAEPTLAAVPVPAERGRHHRVPAARPQRSADRVRRASLCPRAARPAPRRARRRRRHPRGHPAAPPRPRRTLVRAVDVSQEHFASGCWKHDCLRCCAARTAAPDRSRSPARAGRTSHPRPRRLRNRLAQPRLADHLPRRRHPHRVAGRPTMSPQHALLSAALPTHFSHIEPELGDRNDGAARHRGRRSQPALADRIKSRAPRRRPRNRGQNGWRGVLKRNPSRRPSIRA